MNTLTLLAEEKHASIRDIQKNPSRALRGITRVTRGSKTFGFFLSEELFQELLENVEAANSKSHLQRIQKARRQAKARKGISSTRLRVAYEVGK